MAFHLDNILLIDIGNTAVKWIFGGEYNSALVTDFSIDLLPKATQVFVSCVGNQSLLKDLDNTVFVKSRAQFNNFKSAYKKPQDLGVDRFLAMIAAIGQLSDQNVLIIDAGSALTFDLVLANGEHQGGLIMPGLGKLRRSFNQFSTDSKNIALAPLADNTKGGWEFGTAQMLMSVIESQIKYHQTQLGDLQVILTGGNAKMIAYRLNQSALVKQNLVLDGLALYAQSCN